MRVAIFDYRIIPTSPIGRCHRLVLEGLCHDHEFTVFAAEFDNPCPELIAAVRIPVPTRPLALLFITFHVVAPLCYLAHRLRRRARFDLVQIVESNLSFGDLSYAHFCHRSFLRQREETHGASRLRMLAQRLDHRLHAVAEPLVFRRVRDIVVPSSGLVAELEREYPVTAGKLQVISNAVNLEELEPPQSFDRQVERARLGLGKHDLVATFVALGHFERKGLPVLLDALAQLREERIKLVVVGGESGLVAAYRRRTTRQGLEELVRFVGMQRDVRPFLWMSDLFTLPSAYESFSLAMLEAAAARVPLLVTSHYFNREFVVDGVNGLVAERTTKGLAAALRRFASLSEDERRRMSDQAYATAQRYSVKTFVEAWSRLYATLDSPSGKLAVPGEEHRRVMRDVER